MSRNNTGRSRSMNVSSFRVQPILLEIKNDDIRGVRASRRFGVATWGMFCWSPATQSCELDLGEKCSSTKFCRWTLQYETASIIGLKPSSSCTTLRSYHLEAIKPSLVEQPVRESFPEIRVNISKWIPKSVVLENHDI